MRRCTFSNWALLASGPMLVPSVNGSPTLVASAACFAATTASATLERGTSMRVGALQDWPVLRKQDCAPSVTALSRSASSRMMLADLPPSSCVTRLTDGAAADATATPARVEPVNETMATSGCEEMAPPTTGPSPFTMLKTPGGRPVSWRICVKRYADSDAISLGLRTMVHPAASAGATLQTIWFMGQFHGVMSPHTPTGSFRMRVEPLTSSNLKWLNTFTISDRCRNPAGTCAASDSDRGAPISLEMVSAISSVLER